MKNTADQINKENKKDSIKIKAHIFWCQHQKANEMSGKYQVNLCNLSDNAIKALESLGIEIKIGEEEKAVMGAYITCKSSNPLYIFDLNGMPVLDQVGNGSEGVALVGAYEWKYRNKKGISPSLKKLVVTNLVEYENLGNISPSDEDIL